MTEAQLANTAIWILEAMFSAIGLYTIKILIHLKTSVDQININLAKISERYEFHEEKIDGLKEDLHNLRADYYQTREFIKKVW